MTDDRNEPSSIISAETDGHSSYFSAKSHEEDYDDDDDDEQEEEEQDEDIRSPTSVVGMSISIQENNDNDDNDNDSQPHAAATSWAPTIRTPFRHRRPKGKLARKQAQQGKLDHIAATAARASANETANARLAGSSKKTRRRDKRDKLLTSGGGGRVRQHPAQARVEPPLEEEDNDKEDKDDSEEPDEPRDPLSSPGSFFVATDGSSPLVYPRSRDNVEPHPTAEEAAAGEQLRGIQQENPVVSITNRSNHSQSQLVHATLVDPVFAQVNIVDPDDEERENNAQNRKRRLRMILGTYLCLLLVGLGLVLFFLFRPKNDTTAPSSVAPPSPTMAPSTGAPTSYNPFRLPTATWERIVEDPTSPQARAHEWLLDDYDYVEMNMTTTAAGADTNVTITNNASSSSSSSSSSSTRNSNSPTNTTTTTTTTASTTTIMPMTDWRYRQRYALAVLYYATNGRGWDQQAGWLDHAAHECRWYSTAAENDIPAICARMVDDAFEQTPEEEPLGQVTALHLKQNGLKGSVGIPPEVFVLLPALETFELSENDLSGTLVTEVGLLERRLKSLKLNGGRMKGTLPSQLFDLTMLTALELSDHNFRGPLASEVGALTKLSSLRVENNVFSSSLPTELGLVISLARFEFQDNQFISGTIPTQLGRLTRLTTLHGHNNRLRGPLPSQIGNLKELLNLRVHQNALSGPIPTEIGELALAEKLILEYNNFTSSIPSELGRLGALEILRLNNNQLSSRLPSELGQIGSLEILSVQSNRLVGTIPHEIGKSSSLERLLLYENALTGTLPLAFFDYPKPKLERLILHDNLLVGTLPSMLGVLTSLLYCSLHTNSFHGTLPTTIGQLTSLITFSISNTNVSGPVPQELGLLSRLKNGNLSNTDLTGVVPNELCQSEIQFDCSAHLCGCNCTCTGNATTNNHLQNDDEEMPTSIRNETTTDPENDGTSSAAAPTGSPSYLRSSSPSHLIPIPPAPEALAVTCSFRSLVTQSGFAMCREVCQPAECCWNDASFCGSRMEECTSYARYCVNLLHGERLQDQVRAACAAEDTIDCTILCAAASCCDAVEAEKTCDTTDPNIRCSDYQEACNF